MEYSVNKLAKMSGVSARTLRYYDEIGLLCPIRTTSNGYRIYGEKEIDLLQQILFYCELGVCLEEIGKMLNAPDYDKEKALNEHLLALFQRKNQIEELIKNVTKTISTLKGETIMSSNEKFEGFKKKLIADNEEKYGKEIREKHGDDKINSSNQKFAYMSKEQFEKSKDIEKRIAEKLITAFEIGDPKSALASEICELHKEWICMFWKDGTYSKQAHISLAEMYVCDERFTEYYNKIAVGCAIFLRDAIKIYCGE